MNPSPAGSAAAGLSRRQIVAWRNALFVVFALCGLGMASWMARTPAVKEALDASTADMGILILGLATGSILGLLSSSHLIALAGTRRIMAWCLGLGPLGLVLAGFGVTLGPAGFVVVMVGLGTFGFGLAVADVAMNLSGAINERLLGRTVMPIYHAFFSLGTMLGAGVGALTEFLLVPIEIQAIVIAAIIMIAGIVSVRSTQPETVADDPADEAHDTPSTWRSRLSIWRDPRTLMIGLIVLGMALAEGSANDWLALAMVEGHEVDRPTGALVFGVFVTAMTAGRLVGVSLLDRFGRVPVLRVSALLAAIGLLIFIFSPLVWLAVVGVVMWGLGSALGFPTGMSAAADDPRTAAARVSAVATIGYVAFLAGPLVIGFLGEQFGLLHALLFVLVLIVTAGLASPAAREARSIR